MINHHRRTLMASGAVIRGATSAIAHSAPQQATLDTDESNKQQACALFLKPEDVQIMFVDLHPGLVRTSNTNSPQILTGNAGSLARLAKALNIPALFLTVNQGGEPGELVPELSEYADEKNTLHRKNANPFMIPEIVRHLEKNKRKTLVICGFTAETGVLLSVLGAVQHGYNVHVPLDCIGSLYHRTEDAAISQYVRSGATLTSVQSLAALMAPDFSQGPGKTAISVISDIKSRYSTLKN
ncbi:isochorismatase family protein [Rahnella aceris]|uniref:Isochorismatase family protein n=1 Tax=Rahnella sp. (strain Y9602) TaxID=2703885 RepID=A0ABW6CI96_RAHSY